VIQKEDPMIRTSVGALLAITFMTAGSHGQSRPATLPDSEIQKILAERIDVSHQGVGIVVGVIDANGRRVIAHGRSRAADPRPLDSDTIFEIGSVTKVFTALLLADMVQRGEVALDDPISKYLPSGVKAPERNGRAIALVDLATHTSGLPRVPANLRPATFQDPYADYTAEHLDAFLSSYELPREPGTKFEYSNLGGGLLGYLLARRAGMGYAALVRARITGPLGMTSTTAARPGDEDGPRLAAGHNAQLQPVPAWHFDVLAGCGGVRSNANDMLMLLDAFLGRTKTPLAPAMTLMPTVRRPTGLAGAPEIAIGWLVTKPGAAEILWHNGGTFGYRSYLSVDLRNHAGVVVLSNTSTPAGVDDIGRQILHPRR